MTYLVSEVYLPFIDSETGDMMIPVFDGGIMDQPYWTYRVLDLIKLNFKIHSSEKRKEEAQKIQARQKRPRRGL